MSAYDEFCGCGEYSCRQCFNDAEPAASESPTGNVWLDEAVTSLLLHPSPPEGPQA